MTNSGAGGSMGLWSWTGLSLGKGSSPQDYTWPRSWIFIEITFKEDLGYVLGSQASGSIAEVLLFLPQQEDDLNGIHIVAFAEEADPGEGGILGWMVGIGETGRQGCFSEYRLHLGVIPGRVLVA